MWVRRTILKKKIDDFYKIIDDLKYFLQFHNTKFFGHTQFFGQYSFVKRDEKQKQKLNTKSINLLVQNIPSWLDKETFNQLMKVIYNCI